MNNQKTRNHRLPARLKQLFCIVIFIIFYNSVPAQSFLRTENTKIINQKGEEVILKGMGLGGWMLQEGYMLKVNGIGQQQHVIKQEIEKLIGTEKTAQFYQAWLGNHTRKIDIDSMASWGFNSVRLPIHYNLFTLPVEEEPIAGENTWLDLGFAMTDSLLNWCKANNMYLILDLHAAPGGQGSDLNISDRDPAKPILWESEANRQKTITLWKKLAERYAHEPSIAAYDLINEPNWGFTNAKDKNGCEEQENTPLKDLLIEITEAIREVDQQHIIIIEGNCWGNNYNGMMPLWDNNIVLSFHKYWNYNNQASIEGIIKLRDQYNVPIWLGETGENSNLWFRDAIHLMDKNQIGWAWWPLKKLGFNNPLQVKTPTNYQKILDYWTEKGPKPSELEAFQGLMELTENLKLENCIYHPDVIDAMFRQPYSNETKPFKNHIIKADITINAVDYDLGRNGFAYYDLDTATYWVSTGGKRQAWNKGQMYRNDGVDIYYDNSQDNYYIGDFQSGEWLQYTVYSQTEANISMHISVMSSEQAKVSLIINGKALKSTQIPNTQTNWKKINLGSVSLKKGKNVILMKAEKGGFDFQNIQFIDL